MPLLKRVRELHPGITLYLNENYGVTLSELIMSGRMDMAGVKSTGWTSSLCCAKPCTW